MSWCAATTSRNAIRREIYAKCVGCKRFFPASLRTTDGNFAKIAVRLGDLPLRCVVSLTIQHTMSSSESEVSRKDSKKRKREDDDPSLLAPIATPLADRKLAKRLLKLVKQSMNP